MRAEGDSGSGIFDGTGSKKCKTVDGGEGEVGVSKCIIFDYVIYERALCAIHQQNEHKF